MRMVTVSFSDAAENKNFEIGVPHDAAFHTCWYLEKGGAKRVRAHDMGLQLDMSNNTWVPAQWLVDFYTKKVD